MRRQFGYACAASLAVFLTGATPPSVEERLEQDRNLGKAFYENPTTAAEAVVEFKKALDLAPNSTREQLNYALALLHAGKGEAAVSILKAVQKRDPKLPHTWFNLGIWYRKGGQAELAIQQFEAMLKLTPDEPIAHYQLAALLKQQGKNAESVSQFEQAAKLDPLLAAAHFQLYNLYRQMSRQDDAARELQTFQQIRKQKEGAAVPEDVDWCNYAEIYDPPRTPASDNSNPKPVYQDRKLAGTVDAKTAGMMPIDTAGKGQIDLLVWSSKGAALYRGGTELASDSGLESLSGVVDVAPGDFDNDGLIDLCILTEGGPMLFRNTGGRFVQFEANLPRRRFDRAVWVDFDHDYDLDLLLFGEQSALIRNQGTAGFFDRTQDFPFINGEVTSAYKLRLVPDSKAFDINVFYKDRAPVAYRDQLGGHYTVEAATGEPRGLLQIEADFDGDGKADRVRIVEDGSIHFEHNQTPSSRHWIRVQLAGVKSLKAGQDAEVEVKAGRLYKKQMYSGYPLVFDLGDYAEADVIRITWMNGLIQNETRQPANKAYRYEEANRLSGSCPMIWTFDGHGFRFITDVLGVAPLGASDGEGSYFPVDHDEYVSIPGAALKPVDGHYDVRITEELSEVSYLDQVELYAIDHPAGTEIFTNEKFKSPPYPEFRLYGVGQRMYPKTARDSAGQDVRPLLLRKDQRYPAGFHRTESGIADKHWLDLSFDATAPRATLLLNGWVDWPDGSTFRAASQETPLVMPQLQMRDAKGDWKTVDADMGMPAGKPKTIAVPLEWISKYREVRIVTNLCVYWDEIFLAENAANPQVAQTAARLESADLHFRGFSEYRIDPERKQPDTYVYGSVSATSSWNPTSGLYTRYGDVKELTGDVDDRLILMGSGDELSLRFSAAAFPTLKPGWTRDYLLKVDGWAKDRDPNTAFSATVEPLPFHGMSVYPYPKSEHFPDDAAHAKYRREYNTRPALRLLRPLTD
jgi:tetratricopeptide (TPR) repeat protein